jgi:hypothetical protein
MMRAVAAFIMSLPDQRRQCLVLEESIRRQQQRSSYAALLRHDGYSSGSRAPENDEDSSGAEVTGHRLSITSELGT